MRATDPTGIAIRTGPFPVALRFGKLETLGKHNE